MYNFIEDKSILIIPNNYKEKILLNLRNKNKYTDVKILELNEFIKKATYDYDQNTIFYLMNELNISYDTADLYLKNIAFVTNDDNIKMNSLNNVKSIIKDKLIKDPFFLNIIRNRPILVYGYDYITKYQNSILNTFNNVKIIEKTYKNYSHEVLKFKKLEDEVIFVAESVANLINSGVDINKIYLANLNNNYYKIIKRIFKTYNIPINLNEKKSIYNTKIGKYFLNSLSLKANTIFENIKQEFNLSNEENFLIYNKLYDVINEFYFIDNYNLVKENIIYVMKNTYITNNKYTNSVNEINLLNNEIDDDDYIFLLDFSSNSFPKIKKDDDFIEDNIKPSFIEKSYEINNINKDIYYKVISNIKNLTITYNTNYLNETFYPSILIDEYALEVKEPKIEYSIYSDDINKIYLAKLIDNLIKYNQYNENIDLLYASYNLDYGIYNNKYTKINKNSFYGYINNKLTLSYSSIDNFYHCSFKYYISNILNLNSFEDTIQTYIGNLYHYILSKAFLENFDFDNEINKFIKNNPYPISNKSNHFLEKNIEDLKNIINLINYQNALINYDSSLYEKKINVEKNKVINIDFKGFIDKILKLKDLIIIIDYKTYSIDIKLNYLPYGLSMQLPIYLYLTKNMDHNAKVIGIYLQQVLFNKFNNDKNKTIKEQLKNSLKLKGYSIGNETLLEEFDSNYKDSEIIQGMKLTSKGFGAYSKVLSEKQLDNVYKLTEKKIDECIDKIIDANFDINPKKINGENIGCKFCKFNDICFVNNKDIQELEDIKNLDFLN